ncbi:phosphoglycerate kinase [archaeon]|nr:MAG: phosphoglycerate kinase [archaeon]
MQKVYLGNFEPSHFANKAVLVRTDYNTPLYRNENGEYEVISDARIRNSFETLRFLLQGGAKCIVCSHLGRPHGSFEEQFSMKAVYNRLRLLLTDITVKIVGNCIGSEVEQAKRALNKGEVLVLENLRFHVGEEENNRDFARQLAVGVDIFVNEAFSASHRGRTFSKAYAAYIIL